MIGLIESVYNQPRLNAIPSASAVAATTNRTETTRASLAALVAIAASRRATRPDRNRGTLGVGASECNRMGTQNRNGLARRRRAENKPIA